jgi:hypothetical protein
MAGQELTCANCGRVLEVPQLKILKQLAVDDTATVPVSRKSSVNPLSNFLFVTGLVLLVLGLVGAIGLYRYAAGMIVDFSAAKDQIDVQASSLNAGGVLREWYLAETKRELPEWREHPLIRYGKQGVILQKIAYGFAAVAVVGLGVLGAGMFSHLRKKSSGH